MALQNISLSELVDYQNFLIPHILNAGKLTLAPNRSDISVRKKADGTPVTPIDEKIETLLIEKIRDISRAPIIGEEAFCAGHADRLESPEQAYWLIDAVDGTKAYVAGRDDFTVNVSLIQNRQPVLGIIYAPAIREIFYAIKGKGAFYKDAHDNMHALMLPEVKAPESLSIVAGPRPDIEVRVSACFKDIPYKVGKVLGYHSSYKFCVIAKGRANIYPRFGPISEWDIAAGHCILEEAGGRLLSADSKKPITYGRQAQNFRQIAFFALGAGIDI